MRVYKQPQRAPLAEGLANGHEASVPRKARVWYTAVIAAFGR